MWSCIKGKLFFKKLFVRNILQKLEEQKKGLRNIKKMEIMKKSVEKKTGLSQNKKFFSFRC